MNCEYCRCGLDDDEKVCARCGAPNTEYMVSVMDRNYNSIYNFPLGVPVYGKFYMSTSFDDESWNNPINHLTATIDTLSD